MSENRDIGKTESMKDLLNAEIQQEEESIKKPGGGNASSSTATREIASDDAQDSSNKPFGESRDDKQGYDKTHNDAISQFGAAIGHSDGRLPANFRERIQLLNGWGLVLVIEKNLTKTDVRANNGRLSIPFSITKNQFLTLEEKEYLMTRKRGEKYPEMPVHVIEPSCINVREMKLKVWGMKDKRRAEKMKEKLTVEEMKEKPPGTVSRIYNLVKGWNNVVKSNGLSEDMSMQVWAFRAEARLYFALVKVGNVNEGGSSSSSSSKDAGAEGGSNSGAGASSQSTLKRDVEELEGRVEASKADGEEEK